MAASELPPDIVRIAEYMARNAKLSGGSLAWQEIAKMKATLMNERKRWSPRRVAPEAFATQCREVGLTSDDTAEICGFLRKAQANRKLVPQKRYRDFAFDIPYDDL